MPARNIIGNDLGFKRPGFGIALTPGFTYSRGNSAVQFSLGKVIIRDRTKSVAEQVNGVHEGDAAFANYVWMAGYTLRMPGKNHTTDDAANARAHATAARLMPNHANPAASPAAADGFKPFTLRTVDGEKKTLHDYSNKVTLVTFFYPRCPYCNQELPEIQKMYDRYKEKGLSAVWINVMPEENKLIPGWEVAKNLNVPVLVGATQDSLQRDYKIESTPATFVLDGEGRVLYHAEGYKAGDEKTLEEKIETVLTAASPAPTTAAVQQCASPSSIRLAPAIPFALGSGLIQ